jgi:carboxymethylenebutenolidase
MISISITFIVYEPRALEVILSHLVTEPRLGCVTVYGSFTVSVTGTVVPTLCHLTSDKTIQHSSTNSESITIHSYAKSSPFFVLPQSGDYDPGCASLAHSRTLVFLKKHLGGPKFDLEAIWDEHCYFEFEVRSVAKTMATMVVCSAHTFFDCSVSMSTISPG